MENGKDLKRLRDLAISVNKSRENTEIRPQDSVSNIASRDGSRVSTRSSVSSRSSIRSSASAKAKAAAKKAILEAEAATLQRLYAIQEEELRLQQRKRYLELQTDIAKAEAEERVYAEAAAQESRNYFIVDQTGEATEGTVSIETINPVDNTSQEVVDHIKNGQQLQSTTVRPKQPYLPEEETPLTKESRLNPSAAEWSHDVSRSFLPGSPNGDLIVKILDTQDRQSYTFQQLLQQQQQSVMALTLPQPDLPIFDGDPTEYCDFVRAFENLIESKTRSSSARLYYLVQYTAGEVQELMRSCLSMKEDAGYCEARRLLLERYGQGYRIATAFVERITNGPPFKAEDGPGLQKFSILLTSCSNTLKEIGYINKLENPDGLKKIIDRLPYGLKLKWREIVDTVMQKEKRDVTVKDITDFIQIRARVANHPIFGKISSDAKRNDPNNYSKQRPRVRNYGTQGKPHDKTGVGKALKCSSCDANHWLSQCDAFKQMSVEDRFVFVRQKKLCINCLVPGHFVRDCSKKSFCRVHGCTDKHSTFLHPKQPRTDPPSDKLTPGEKDEDNSRRSEEDHAAKESNNGYVRTRKSPLRASASMSTTGLAVVPVRVKAKGKAKTVETYAFLDSGSNTSFCTEKLMRLLNLKGTKMTLSLTTMESANAPIETSYVNLEVLDLNEDNVVELPMVFSRPSLPISRDSIADQKDVNRWPHLKGINIPHIEAEIGLLIGSDAPEALQPIEVRESKNGGPFATRTVLGWVLNGPLGRRTSQARTANFVEADVELNQQFERFCDLEFNDSIYDPKTSMSQNDKRALNVMESTAKLTNGHHEIALPWKNYPPCLKNNKSLAENRLKPLKRRLERDPAILVKYKEVMSDLLRKGYARQVRSHDLGSLDTRWYLPHHAVFNPQKPGKIRVVFDCSAKFRGTSLNDQLLQGPDLTNSLVGVLTRFREEAVAFMSDVEAMFHQVRVRPSDCDALRFLWWPDGKLDQPPKEFQMTVHLFGGASSPSCANFALRKTAEDNKEEFDPVAIETVQRNFYVDDCLKSVNTEKEAIQLANQLRELLAKGGFRLTKWVSNSREVINSLPESEIAASVKDLDLEKLPVERALGVQWNVTSDQFGFKIAIKERPATRRGILSVVSSVYDPLGFAAPFIFQAKLILQELCRKKLGWDDEIPEEDHERWQIWLKELPKLEELAIDRCFKPTNVGKIKSSQLHHFSDASQKGYGAVTYLRIADDTGKVHCSFVMGKSRLAPLKPVTIPRMELSAAVVATRLDRITRQELSLPVDQSYFWTDSTCVLRYIENEARRFQTFVANRIATIREASSPCQWRYVDTQSNPADEASRGVSVDSLQRWIHGPSFLLQPCERWPQRPVDMRHISNDDPEIKKAAKVYANSTSPPSDFITNVFQRFSSWSHLKKIVAWILRYKANLQRVRNERKKGKTTDIHPTDAIKPVSVIELKNAEREILKHVQSQCFKEELLCLNDSDQPIETKKPPLKKSSAIYKLDPILDHGLIRVGGRLQRAPVDSEAKHPVILPKTHHVVKLIVRYYHQAAGHSGLEYTLSLIRQRYWIINARSNIRNIVNTCVDCRRRQAPAPQQKMASLPEDRITPSKPPFTYVGVDCFGPFEARRGRSNVKRYGVIFTCLVVRAVHIEVAHSMDTESFINALRRFIARRGQPQEMRSDNGGNFVKGEKELRQAVNAWNQQQVHEFLLQHEIKWTFNPPTGSHHGGVWERCIRTVRKVMKAITREQVLDDEGLHTLMCEVESVVNGRPITKVSDDPRDLEALTPNHLLLLRPGITAPPGKFTKDDIYSRRRWRQVQYLADVFWRRWIREYLPSLQERQKWNKTSRNFVVNDIVLVLDDKTPRSCWPLGRIMEVYTNREDGLVRSVKLKTNTSVLVRPINKIVLLETAATSSNDK